MKRAIQHTATAAVLAVGAELSRRGYDVSFTMGNTAKIDMLCAVPNGNPFKVQVKGVSNRNGLYVQEEFFVGDAQPDLYLVVVYVPKYVPELDTQGAFEFHILSHDQAKHEFEKMSKFKKDGRPYIGGSGLNWSSVSKYKDAWGVFPKHVFTE